MAIEADFGGVDAQQGGGMPDPGKYLCIIDDVEEKTASTGTPGIGVTFRIRGGDFDDRLLWDNIWITERALGRAKWCLECAGIKVPDGRFSIEPRQLIGAKVVLTVRHEEYQAKDGATKVRAAVKAWDKPGAEQQSAASTKDDDIPF